MLKVNDAKKISSLDENEIKKKLELEITQKINKTQNPDKYLDIRYMGFEGGGIKLVAAVGALSKLDLFNLHAVSGVSAGSLIAMLLAIGYSTKELEEEVLPSIDFTILKDDDIGFIRDAGRFLTSYGYYKGDELKKLVKDLIKKKNLDPDITFAELHNLREKEIEEKKQYFTNGILNEKEQKVVEHVSYHINLSEYKDLYLNATDLNTGHIVTFSHESKYYKDVPIWQACYASMAFPAAFPPIKIKDSDGIEDLFLDPGLTNTFPDVFSKKKYIYTETENPESRAENPYFVGVKVDANSEIVDYQREKPNRREIKDIFDALDAVIKARNANFIENRDFIENKALQERIIVINDGGVDTLDFDLSKDQINMLVENGKIAAYRFLQQRLALNPKELSKVKEEQGESNKNILKMYNNTNLDKTKIEEKIELVDEKNKLIPGKKNKVSSRSKCEIL